MVFFKIVQKARKIFSADAHMWQKVQAMIIACLFCPSISPIFPDDITYDGHGKTGFTVSISMATNIPDIHTLIWKNHRNPSKVYYMHIVQYALNNYSLNCKIKIIANKMDKLSRYCTQVIMHTCILIFCVKECSNQMY